TPRRFQSRRRGAGWGQSHASRARGSGALPRHGGQGAIGHCRRPGSASDQPLRYFPINISLASLAAFPHRYVATNISEPELRRIVLPLVFVALTALPARAESVNVAVAANFTAVAEALADLFEA